MIEVRDNMNTKTIEMIYILLENNGIYTLGDLSNYFEISNRMIRNYIDQINAYFNSLDAFLYIDESGYIILEGNRSVIELKLDHIKYSDYAVMKDERLKLLFLSLFFNMDTYITLSDIAESIYVSRSTVVNDFKNFRDEMSQLNISVDSKPHHGIRFNKYTLEINDYFINLLINDFNIVKRFIIHLADENDKFYDRLLMIEKILLEVEEEVDLYLAPRSFKVLTYYLFSRCGSYESSNDTEVSSQFGEKLVEKLQHKLFEFQKENLEDFLGNLRFVRRDKSGRSMIQMQMVTRQFIEEISKDLEVDLNKNYIFYESLSNHLASVMSNHSPVLHDFPEITKLVNNRLDIKRIVKRNVSTLEKITYRKLTDLEINYIVIYVSAAIEQMKNAIKLDVLVVCDSGIATAQLLKAKIAQNLSIDNIHVASSRVIHKEMIEKYDLIISTVPLQIFETTQYIRVTPLLNSRDLELINGQIDEVKEALIRNPEMIKTDNLVDQFLEKDNLGNFLSLSDLLTNDYVEVGVEASDWEDAIKKSAKAMLDNNDIDNNYIDRMIDVVKREGPYIVISPGVAFPHSDYSEGTFELAMSLIVLKEPVAFGNEEYDPVRIVCSLSPIDNQSHLRAFFTLCNLLQNNYYKELIINAKSSEFIVDLINKYERDVNHEN